MHVPLWTATVDVYAVGISEMEGNEGSRSEFLFNSFPTIFVEQKHFISVFELRLRGCSFGLQLFVKICGCCFDQYLAPPREQTSSDTYGATISAASAISALLFAANCTIKGLSSAMQNA